jgi:squalene-hopene/tetraprenyl-beta-curcumene cyclase
MAVASGLLFLASRQDADGLWRDFDTLAGRSVDWVSGYVLTAIGELPGAWRLCEAACASLLTRQQRSGGWGYNERIPPDADSTAWVLRGLLCGSFPPPHSLRSALEFLSNHQDEQGGFATFLSARPIGDVIREPNDREMEGWRSPHVCVTTNVTLALLESGVHLSDQRLVAALDYLRAAMDRDGLLRSYWWNGPTYATYHGVLALTAAGRLDSARLVAIRNALVAWRSTDGGWGDAHAGDSTSHTFATANALLCLLLAPRRSEGDQIVHDAAAWLHAHQAADGSWPSTPILRIPDAHVSNPERPSSRPSRTGTGIVVADDRRCYTTATALHSLHRYQRVMTRTERLTT